ncbi:hypothetical protein HMJ29_06030 [Hymenobacter taeanensis]|uniref:Sphingomyelin synthase-like domain-containing protein n=1 Tax=Hymenobacter taeanensis TaxID=2735321 RepID=A0A6M6BE86_9BACT|nr:MULTISPECIES: phosphatase PAP2-related protein [Hymenobacter]QJX46517.1 hypothetical protein HMJ29_06030 [Hymenobacter taeanensis]UOQ80378.1 hypothetical protein MUN83_16350 [Hymenobacter sp. 5414T-23]
MHLTSISWREAWAQPAFRGRLLTVLGLLLVLATALPRFFAWVQARPGRLLPDPFLAWLPAHDVSGPAFAVIYLGIGLGVATLAPRPLRLLRALWAYLLLHLLRCCMLFLLPLEPPQGLILLHDPLVDRFFYAAPTPITKDLFFSGHTATLLLLTLAVPPSWQRSMLAIGTLLIGSLVLIQHAHYAYDVLGAVPFTLLAYWLAGRITKAP